MFVWITSSSSFNDNSTKKMTSAPSPFGEGLGRVQLYVPRKILTFAAMSLICFHSCRHAVMAKSPVKTSSIECRKNGTHVHRQCSLTITQQPISQTDCYGNLVKFSVVVANAVGRVTYRWQQMPPGSSFSNITGATSALLEVYNIGVSGQNINGTLYRVIVSDNCGSVTSAPATLTVNEISGITPQKTLTKLCTGGNFSFTASTAGSIPVSYQWLKDGNPLADGTFNGTTFSGSTSPNLMVSHASAGESGSYRIRLVFKVIDGISVDKTCQITSQLIRNVTVTPPPSPSLSSSDADNLICANQSLTFTAATGGNNYNFRVNGISVQNSSSNTYTTTGLTNGQTVDVVVSSAEGCDATSAGITTTVNPYPDPNPIITN